MSVPVELSEIERVAAGFPVAYLLTAGEGGRVHLLAVTPRCAEQAIIVGGVGRHTAANVHATGRATLLWSPAAATDYSLIVDGDATVDGRDAMAPGSSAVPSGGDDGAVPAGPTTILVVPTKAILHRPATNGVGDRVGNDCVTLPPR